MLNEICGSIHNYFTEDADKHFGKFTVSGGVIAPLSFLKDGQYFRIIGSTFNDGIYQYPTSELTDEEFDGAIWGMKIPPAFIALSEEIKSYAESEQAKPSQYTSESFGGYSYTKATNRNGCPVSWNEVFASRLNKWRKI